MDLREYAHHIESELDIVGQDHEDDCKISWRDPGKAIGSCRLGSYSLENEQWRMADKISSTSHHLP
jgi:hypothetical protein